MALLDVPPTAYRTRFFLRLAGTTYRPLLGTLLLLRLLAGSALSVPATAALCAGTLALWFALLPAYNLWSSGRYAAQHSAEGVPRVKGRWPGNIDVMLKLAKDLRAGYVLQAFDELLDEYGTDTLNTRIMWKDTIITRDDAVMRAIHSTHFNSFERGPDTNERMATFLGNGIFATDGEVWKQNRAMIRPFFHKERLSDLQIVAEHAAEALSILGAAAAAQRAIDIQDLFQRFTLDAGAAFLCGVRARALAAPRPVPFAARLGAKGAATDDAFGTFAHAFEDVQVRIAMRSRRQALWPLYEMWADATRPDVEVITGWVKPVVERALREKRERRARGAPRDAEERTLLDSLVERTDDEEAIRFGILNVLMAARDTTAGLLSFATYLLAMHPEVMQRLRHEVLDTCGASGHPPREALSALPYMSAVLSETLRLFPGAPMGIRTAREDVLVASPAHAAPLHIPRGARINWLTLPLHRRADLWGADAQAFRPERWLDPQLAARLAERPSVYIPFLQGPRVCPGKEFALQEASYMLACLLQRFSRIELVPEALPKGAAPPAHWKQGKGRQAIEKCWPATAFTIYVKGGLWVRLHE
ncbi:cytochrome P450 monooxygenase CYP63 [Obba rivulosa]|uniref:Cytochrome P450 monooxygenase CYP63 n=1 Tax=Obba rivulosa TaxID=1052685 RepID=A0A8E2AVG9_9APHY|nr:cytochrome P450 monooxygenase CYP63 [Obba rivulosa]